MRVTLVHPAGFNFVPGQPDLVELANRMAPIGVPQLASRRRRRPCWTPGPRCRWSSATCTPRRWARRCCSTFRRSTTCAWARVKARCSIWRDGKRIRSNPRRARIERLDDLPYPAYDKLPGYPRHYQLPLFSCVKRYGATTITSRGCPFTCSFCDRTVFEHKYRYNSAAYIHEHMRFLRDRFGVHHVNFYDDLFTATRKRIHELCNLMISRPLGMHFNCAIRAGQDDAEMLRKLKAGVTLDEVRATVRDIHADGLRAKGLFIFGLPGETPQTVRTTSAFIQELGLDEINISKFSPLHGAPIRDKCISGDAGHLHEDWRLMNCMNFVFLPTLLTAKRYYDSDRHGDSVGLRNFPLHPRQPLALPPVFSPGLLVGKQNASARETILLQQAA